MAKSLVKQVRDQVLHAGLAAFIVLLSWVISSTVAYFFNGSVRVEFTDIQKFLILVSGIFIVMVIAWLREQDQHPGQCGKGCIIDLIFWFIGAMLMAFALFNYG